MSKRFTDQGKWDDPWFFDLSAENKLVWLYLCDKCDIAGIWKVSIPHIKFSIGSDVDVESFLEVADGRIIPIDDGKKWYIPSFVKFQNGNLVANNNCHKAILKILSDHGLLENSQGLVSPSAGALEPPCNGKGKGKGKSNGREEEDTSNTGSTQRDTEVPKKQKVQKDILTEEQWMTSVREETQEMQKAWRDWWHHRVAIKKPITRTSGKAFVEKVIRYGEKGYADKVPAMIYTAIENEWQTIYGKDERGNDL